MTPPNAGSVPAQGDQLAQSLAEREAAARAKSKPPAVTLRRLNGELIEDKAELCIVLDKKALLEAIGPGTSAYRTQEGVNLTVDGTFSYLLGDREYTFHLHLFPAWARVDMVVGK